MTDYEGLFTDAFLAEVEDRKAGTTYPPEEWTAGGRASKAWPQKEDASFWLTTGPKILEKWALWWEDRKAEGWTIWEAPGGVPAIELEVKARIGSVLFRGYIDAIFIDPDGDLLACDWKAGSMEPVAPIQLGLYRVALQKTLGVDVRYGGFFMAKKASDIPHIYDLSIYSEEMVTPWLERSARMEAEGLYIPHPSNLCGACAVRDFCKVMGGERAHEVPAF